MSHHPTDPQRWSDATGRSGTIEELAGASLRRARQASEPSDAALARAARRLDQPAPRSRVALLVWRVALVLVLLVATGGVVGAALYRWWGGGDTAAPAPAAAPQSSRGAARPAHARRRGPQEAIAGPEAESESELPEAATLEPAAETPPSPTAAPAGAITRERPVAEPALVPPRPARARAAFDEGTDLGRVFHALRAGGDPAAALRALDQHDRRFPHGVLATEARLARAEALVALGRRAEALPLLTGIEEGGDALAPEARVTRGELLADAHRCAAAERDFDVVISAAADAPAGVRALYGRARCRQAAGDAAAARRALEQLLSNHPDDGYAKAAHRLLQSLAP